METPVTESVVSENIFKAGYKIPWTYYLIFVVIFIYLAGNILWLIVGMHLFNMVTQGKLDMLPHNFVYGLAQSIAGITICLFCGIWYTRWISNISRYSYLDLSPSGLTNKVGYYRTDNINWTDIICIYKIISLGGQYPIYIKLDHGWILLRSDMLFDADETIKLIRQYANLDAEKSNLFYTKYQRKT